MTVDLNSRYGLNPAHSEVVEACQIIEPCGALDMGCSNGRNAQRRAIAVCDHVGVQAQLAKLMVVTSLLFRKK